MRSLLPHEPERTTSFLSRAVWDMIHHLGVQVLGRSDVTATCEPVEGVGSDDHRVACA